MTLSQALSILSADLLRDPSYWVWSRANLTRLLNNSYIQLQSDLKWFLSSNVNSATISLIAWTQEYSLPADFLTVDQVNYQDLPLDRIEKKDIDNAEWTPDSYYLFGWSIWFYPKPTESWSVKLFYDSSLSELALDADTILTPKVFDYCILYLSASNAFKQVMKLDQSAIYEQEYYKELNKGKVLVVQDLNIDYHPWQ